MKQQVAEPSSQPTHRKDDRGYRDSRDGGAVSLQPSRLARLLTPAFLLGAAVFVYCQVFVLPATPRFPFGDQCIYLNNAARMIDGELIYRDYHHFTTPGTDVLYAALFKLFGVRTWIPQAMLIVVGVFTVWIMIRIATKVIGGANAYLPALMFLALAYSSYRDGTHHWYSSLAAAAALSVVLENRSNTRIACAGLLWGLGAFFTQSVALGVAGLGVFLGWEAYHLGKPGHDLLRRELILLVSFMTTIAACCSYFMLRVGIKRFLYFTIVFVAKYYSADKFNTWRVYLTGHPSLNNWMSWPDLASFAFIHFSIPLVYILFIVRYLGEHKRHLTEPWSELMLINTIGIFLFFTIASAPAFSRLCAVSLPAMILWVWFLKPAFAVERSLLRCTWLMVVAIAIARPIIEQLRPRELLTLPTGRTAFTEPILYEKCKWVLGRSHPFQFFFGDQGIAFSLRLRNAGPVSFLRPTDYTRPEEVDELLFALERHRVEFVSWYSGLDREGLLTPAGDHLGPVRSYLHQHYRLAKVFSNGDQIWEHR